MKFLGQKLWAGEDVVLKIRSMRVTKGNVKTRKFIFQNYFMIDTRVPFTLRSQDEQRMDPLKNNKGKAPINVRVC